LRSSLDFIEKFALKYKKRTCFAFDEFGDIEKLDGIAIIKLFRGIIQGQKQSVFIFSGSYESVMDRLFVSSKAPFYRMVRIIQPGFIEKESLLEFATRKFLQLGIPFIKDDVIGGVEFTAGHPYYFRLFIQEYYFQYLQEKRKPDLAVVLDNMMQSENSYLEKLWDETSKSKETRIVIIKTVETGKPYSGSQDKGINISRALRELIGKGIVISDGSIYRVTDPLFEEFIRQRVL